MHCKCIKEWIPIEKVSELLNIKEKTIKNYCYQGSFIYKIENQNGNRHLYILSL